MCARRGKGQFTSGMCWIACFLALAAASLLHIAATTTPEDSTPRVTCRWVKGTGSLGDRLSLAVEIGVEKPDYYLSDELAPGIEWGPAYVSDVKALAPASIPGLLRLDVSLQVFDTGRITLPPLRVSLNSGGERAGIEIRPPPLDILPLLQEGQAAPPAAAPFAYPEPFPWVPALFGISLAAAAAVWLWRLSRRRNLLAHAPAAVQKPQERDPDAWIREEVERILRSDMDSRTRYGVLSQRLREYFQIKTSHPFSDWTTLEIRTKTGTLELFSEEVREMLLRTLALCDMAKFAKYEPKKSERDSAAETLRKMLSTYTSARAVKNE